MLDDQGQWLINWSNRRSERCIPSLNTFYILIFSLQLENRINSAVSIELGVHPQLGQPTCTPLALKSNTKAKTYNSFSAWMQWMLDQPMHLMPFDGWLCSCGRTRSGHHSGLCNMEAKKKSLWPFIQEKVTWVMFPYDFVTFIYSPKPQLTEEPSSHIQWVCLCLSGGVEAPCWWEDRERYSWGGGTQWHPHTDTSN